MQLTGIVESSMAIADHLQLLDQLNDLQEMPISYCQYNQLPLCRESTLSLQFHHAEVFIPGLSLHSSITYFYISLRTFFVHPRAHNLYHKLSNDIILNSCSVL